MYLIFLFLNALAVVHTWVIMNMMALQFFSFTEIKNEKYKPRERGFFGDEKYLIQHYL